MPRTAASEIHSKVVGREIRATRHALGLTQADIAERLGASASYISAVEAGRRNLTLGQLANIANAMRLGVNVSFIRPDGTPVAPQTTSAGALAPASATGTLPKNESRRPRKYSFAPQGVPSRVGVTAIAQDQ